jgi:hypothetical protein
MRKPVIAAAFALVALAAWAEGPGTRLRTTPEVPQAVELRVPPAKVEPARTCDGLSGDARERCQRERREPEAERRTRAPEATSGTSSAASAPR